MGTTSKGKRKNRIDRKKWKSTKPLKQWCKARGVDFKAHCTEYNIKLSTDVKKEADYVSENRRIQRS